MINELRTLDTPRGAFVFRPECPDDEPFLFRLFAAHHGGTMRQSGIAPDLIDKLMKFQFQSQNRSYRTMYPDAIYSIIIWQHREVGRFIEYDETEVVCFVDFLLDPEYQAKGLGPAITWAVMQEWAARGRGTRVEVRVSNEPCLKMCRKLGFTESAPDGRAYVDLRWYPPRLARS